MLHYIENCVKYHLVSFGPNQRSSTNDSSLCVFQTWEDLCKIPESPPMMPLAGFGRNYSVDLCGSQQPGVALETTKERGVALVTDEMRGYPDKNTTGTHLARPRCPLSDR